MRSGSNRRRSSSVAKTSLLISEGITIAKSGRALPPLARQIRFDKSAQVADHHLVANAEHDRSIVAVRFHVGREASRAEIAGKQPVMHALRAVREFLARHSLAILKRKRVASTTSDESVAAMVSFIPRFGRMILSAVHNRNSGMPAHEQFQHLLAAGSNSRAVVRVSSTRGMMMVTGCARLIKGSLNLLECIFISVNRVQVAGVIQ